ncbi:MAG TPA: MFS transporter [Candidatus Saccharimonadales bacterium]
MSKQQRLVLVVSILASFVGAIDGFIVNIALPAISRSLGGGLTVQQWTVDGYLLTLGALILVAGSLSDVFGRKRILQIGLWWFGIASLLCAVAPNGAFLVSARIFQGVAGALLVPSSLAIIISAFSGPAQSKAIGIWTAWFSMSSILGPILGGVLIAAAGWRLIFIVNVIPIAVTLVLLRRLALAEAVPAKPHIDWPGVILCALGLAGLVFGFIEQPSYGWMAARTGVPLGVGAVLLGAFLWWERHTPAPVLTLSLFRRRNFSWGNIATAMIYAGLSISSFIIVVTLQQVGGYSALQAALAMLPTSVLMFALSGRFGSLAGRYGPRWFMTLGPVVAALGFLLMLRVQPHVRYLADLFPGVVLFGVGLSMTVAPLTAAILGCVEPKHAGIASAVNNAVARIAGLIGVALIGLMVGEKIAIAGFHRTLVVVAALLLLGGIVSAIGIQNPKQGEDLV